MWLLGLIVVGWLIYEYKQNIKHDKITDERYKKIAKSRPTRVSTPNSTKRSTTKG